MRSLLFLGALVLAVRAQEEYVYAPILEAGVQLLFVEGLGRVDIFTNVSRVDMGIVRTLLCNETDPGCSALIVQQSVQQAASKVVKALANTPGVTGISSSGQSLEVVSYYNNTLGITFFQGYRSRASLSAVVPSADMGTILDLLFDAGVNSISGVSYYVSDQQLSTAKAEALELATKNALSQAKAVLDPLGKPIVETRQVVFPYDSYPYESRPASILSGSDINGDTADLLSRGRTSVGYRVKLKVKFGQLNDTADAAMMEEKD